MTSSRPGALEIKIGSFRRNNPAAARNSGNTSASLPKESARTWFWMCALASESGLWGVTGVN